MPDIKLTQSTVKYAEEFGYWKETAEQFFANAAKQIEAALQLGDDTSAVDAMADAWHRCIAAQWTLLKSGKQTANRMALRRGVDHRQFHPAQLKKKKAEEAVEKALKSD